MNAKVETLFHYRDVEQQAREVVKAKEVIRELRGELSAVICEIQRTASAIKDVDALIARAKATLSRTQPRGDEDQPIDANGFPLKNLDAMTKPQRRNELMDVIANICLPPVHRANCDACNERPWTHRHDTSGIETYVCDECHE